MRRGQSIEQTLRDQVAAGRYREAVSLFLESNEGTAPLSSEAAVLAAQAASRIGEFDLTARLAGSAERGFRADGNAAGLLESTNLLGVVAFERGEIDDAERCFRETVDLAVESGCARFTARGSNNLANIAHLRGRPEAAIALYLRALEVHREGGDQRGIAEALHNLSLAYRGLGQADKAMEACGEALGTAKSHGGGLLALVLLGRSELHIDAGAFDEALSDIDRAEFLAWQEGSQSQLLEAGRIRAALDLRRGNAAASHRQARQVHSSASTAGYALVAALAASIAALALKTDGQPAEALAMREVTVLSLGALGAAELMTRFERSWDSIAA